MGADLPVVMNGMLLRPPTGHAEIGPVHLSWTGYWKCRIALRRRLTFILTIGPHDAHADTLKPKWCQLNFHKGIDPMH